MRTEAIDPKSVRNDTLIFASRLCAISLHAKVCTLTRSCMYQQIKGLVLLFTNNSNIAHACLRPGSGHSLSRRVPLLINNNNSEKFILITSTSLLDHMKRVKPAVSSKINIYIILDFQNFKFLINFD